MSWNVRIAKRYTVIGRPGRASASIAVMVAVLGTMLAATTPARAITNGTPDGAAHPYVGETFDGNEYCSGSLISAKVLVTAAHCSPPSQSKFDTDPVTGAQRMALTFDPQGFPNDPAAFMDTTLTVFGDYYPDPQFSFTPAKGGLTHFDNHDIGIVVLDQPIPPDVTTTFASLPALGQTTTLPRKTLVTLVGYGVQAFLNGGGPPQPVQTFTRDAAQSTIVQSNDTLSETFLKLSSGSGSGNGQVCNGDSGGPVLLHTSSVLLAENSFVNGQCTAVAYATRLDTTDSLNFIQSTVAQHSAG